MSFFEEVIRNAARIEDRLAAHGGNGSGIYELSSSIRPPLDRDLFARIQTIAAVRNKFAHEHNFRYEGNESEFLAICESVLMELGAQPQQLKAKSNSNSSSNIDARSSLDQTHMGGAMGNKSSNIWVEVDNKNFRGNEYESTLEKRLVFYAGGGVTVKPLGRHKAGPRFNFGFHQIIDAIGLVKMTSGHQVITTNGGIATNDGIPVEIEIELTIKVLDNVPAITRVALDADSEQILIRNSALTAIRTVIGKCGYQDLNLGAKLSEIEQGAKKTMLLDKHRDSSFEVTNVSIKKVTASDAAIREHAVRIAQAKVEKKEYEDNQELLRKKDDAERIRRKAMRDDEREHLKNIADDKSEEAKRQEELDSKRRKEEDATKIELAKIEAQKQIAIAGNNDLKRYFPMLINSAIFKGKVDAFEQVAEKNYGMNISHTFTDEADDTPSTSGDEATGKSTAPPSPPKPSADGDGSDQPG